MNNKNNKKEETIKSHESIEELYNTLNNVQFSRFTIVSALDKVVEAARGSKLNNEFWAKTTKELAYLRMRLGLTSEQIVIVGILCELGTPISWRMLGKYLGFTRLYTMTLTDAIDDLKAKGWLMSYIAQEGNLRYDGYKLVHGVVTAMRKNEKFVPEDLSGMKEQGFVDRLCRFFKFEGNDPRLQYEDKVSWLKRLTNSNLHLPLCSQMTKFEDESSMFVLLLTIIDYARYAGSIVEGISEEEISNWFDDDFESDRIVSQLTEGTHELFKSNILEYATEDGLATPDRWRLTASAREKLLGGFATKSAGKKANKKEDRDLKPAADIVEKKLFFNPAEKAQISRIENVISIKNLDKVKKRFTKKGMRTGIISLFYGAPGTGKTESVLQLARSTGRDIMQVNIAGMRDKYVGESEKNIKRVFERYHQLCKDRETMPILFFNEADAIFGNRFESVHSSVEKMDNAIQNIILQEMETFEGILFATTNLTSTLDDAFDRRFLFKVEFAKPSEEARVGIWRSMMSELKVTDCKALAKEFDLSGGQIENIARKCKIEYITTGRRITLDMARTFCGEEHLNRSNSRSRVGF